VTYLTALNMRSIFLAGLLIGPITLPISFSRTINYSLQIKTKKAVLWWQRNRMMPLYIAIAWHLVNMLWRPTGIVSGSAYMLIVNDE